MAQTTVTTELEDIKLLKLTEGTISIGRAEDNDLSIHDTFVSAHHARIFTYQSASYIEDLESTNGIYLNGKKVLKHTLHSGDIVSLGKHQFKIESQEQQIA
jgi:pSer/pThr/pTyr-binding forkhead associated (FHA) protein